MPRDNTRPTLAHWHARDASGERDAVCNFMTPSSVVDFASASTGKATRARRSAVGSSKMDAVRLFTRLQGAPSPTSDGAALVPREKETVCWREVRVCVGGRVRVCVWG